MPLGSVELADLIDRLAAPLRVWASRVCASPEDAVQEALCRLVTLEPAPLRPSAWLYRAVRNAALGQQRAQRRRRLREQVVSTAEQHEPDPALGMISNEVLRAVDQLEDSLRDVLVARIWGELTLDEIAELCGVSRVTAFRRYRQALEEVRSRLGVQCLSQND